MDPNILEQAGLTKNEAKTYLTLLELGSTSAGPLIKRLGMHRAAVYNLLDLLVDKGLVSYTLKGGRKYFEAQNPLRLLEYIDQKKRVLENKRLELKKIIPELQKRRKLSQEEQEGTIYKGKEGIKSIFEDILIEKRPWFVFGATGKFKELFHAYFIHFHNRRARLKIPLKIIFDERIKSEKREKELTYSKIRYLPKHYIKPSTTFIYSDKVTIIIWSPEPMAFLIRSKNVADSYRDFFDILWKSAKM